MAKDCRTHTCVTTKVRSLFITIRLLGLLLEPLFKDSSIEERTFFVSGGNVLVCFKATIVINFLVNQINLLLMKTYRFTQALGLCLAFFLQIFIAFSAAAQTTNYPACPQSTTSDCNLVCFGNFEVSSTVFKDFLDFFPTSIAKENSSDLCRGSNTNAITFPTVSSSEKKTPDLNFGVFFCATAPFTINRPGNFLHLAVVNGKPINFEGVTLPLKKPLEPGRKYTLSFKALTGCPRGLSIHFSKTKPCNQASGIAMNYSTGLTTVSSCGYKDDQAFFLDVTGNFFLWATHVMTFTAKEASEHITIVANAPTPATQNPESIYLDDIELTTKSPKVTIVPKVVESCIGGEFVIEYETCYPASFPIQNITFTPTPNTLLPLGLTNSTNSGNFPNGNVANFNLPKIANDERCNKVKLVLKVPQLVQDQDIITIPMAVRVNSCDRTTPFDTIINVTHTFKKPDAGFNHMHNFPCNGIVLTPTQRDTSFRHYWEIRNINNVLVATSSDEIFTRGLGPQQYYITHTVYYKFSPTSVKCQVTSRELITLDPCPDFYCACFKSGYNIGKPGTRYSIKTTKLHNSNQHAWFIDCIAIAGTLIVDENFTFLGCNVTMEPFSEIRVTKGNKLTINRNSDIHGCNELWRGIVVEEGATLEIIDSRISDAQYAITLNHKSVYKIVNNRFEKNYVGIYIPRSTTVQIPQQLNGYFLSSNTFTGLNTPLLSVMPSYAGKYSRAGIELYDCLLNIGDPFKVNFINNINYFEHLDYGIIGESSSIYVDWATMTNIKKTGISLNKAMPNTNKFKFTRVEVAYSSFTSLHTAIDCNYTAFFGDEIKTDSVMFGILLVHPLDLMLEDSEIKYIEDGFRFSGNILGILGRPFFGNSEMYHINKPIEGYTSLAITAQSFDARAVGYFLIQDVTINLDAPGVRSNYPLLGAWIGVGKGLTFVENYVNPHVGYALSTTTKSLSHQIGIEISNSDQIRLKNNWFMVPEITNSNNQSIHLIESTNTMLCCNYTDFSKTGLAARGSLTNFKLRHHIFGGHPSRQIQTNNTAELSLQENAKNNFTSVPGTVAWGMDTITNYKPYQPYIDASLFLIEEDFTGTNADVAKWANNNIRPKLLNPGIIVQGNKDWFRKIPPSTTITCANDLLCDDNLFSLVVNASKNDTMAARGYFKNAPFGNMTSWRSARLLYTRLNENPALRNNILMDSFYTVKSNSSMAKLATIESRIGNLAVLSSEEKLLTSGLSKRIKNTSTDLNNKYKEMLLTTDSIALISLKADTDILVAQLSSSLDSLGIALENIRTKRHNDIQSIKQDNLLIQTEALWDKNEKEINDVLLNSILDYNIDLSDAQKAKIRNIAFQCELEGGRAVTTARAIFHLWDKRLWIDEEFCTNIVLGDAPLEPILSRAASVTTQKDLKTNISPNPATKEIKVSVNCNNCSIKIFSVTGSLLVDRTLSETETQINVEHLLPGLYQCQILAEGKVIDAKKIVIIH